MIPKMGDTSPWVWGWSSLEGTLKEGRFSKAGEDGKGVVRVITVLESELQARAA